MLSPSPATDPALAVTRRVLWAALLAGLIAGCFVTVLQALKVTPLIHAAEIYETAAQMSAAHDHGAAAAWEPADGIERTTFTLLANVLTAIGFGLLLSGAFALRQAFGGRGIDARSGVLWGLGGFAAFALAPSFGLPPELPGSLAGDLIARQAWWTATALGTAAGLLLLVFAPRLSWKAVGGVALALPHVIGAPAAPHLGGSAPPELAAAFTAASLVTAALFWIVLGGGVGYLYSRVGPRP
jgi:cobalt transporter subunit CbtA